MCSEFRSSSEAMGVSVVVSSRPGVLASMCDGMLAPSTKGTKELFFRDIWVKVSSGNVVSGLLSERARDVGAVDESWNGRKNEESLKVDCLLALELSEGGTL